MKIDYKKKLKESQKKLKICESNILTFIHKTIEGEYEVPKFNSKLEMLNWYKEQLLSNKLK